jgi:hypothetical protein
MKMYMKKMTAKPAKGVMKKKAKKSKYTKKK